MFYSHSGSDKKRSMADLAKFAVNDKVVQEPGENFTSSNNTPWNKKSRLTV